jgi:hypothetical protein
MSFFRGFSGAGFNSETSNKDSLRGSVPTKESPQLQQQHQRHSLSSALLKAEVNSKIVPSVVKSLSVPPVLSILSDSWSVSTSDKINAGLQHLLRFLTNWQCISICFYWVFPFLLRSVRLSVYDGSVWYVSVVCYYSDTHISWKGYPIGSLTPKINIHLMAYKKKQTVWRCLPSKILKRTYGKVVHKQKMDSYIVG